MPGNHPFTSTGSSKTRTNRFYLGSEGAVAFIYSQLSLLIKILKKNTAD